jgi:heavy metal efflux system protein
MTGEDFADAYPACYLMIFLLLMSALGSARDALLVFSAVPLALTGAC